MEDWIKKIREAGIVGAGGAGFPSYVKYNAKVDTLIANGAECEPLLKTDQAVMLKHSHEVIKALQLVGENMGAKGIFIAIKKKHGECIDEIKKAIDEEGSSIKVYELDDYYPAGDEFILVHQVTGKVIPPAGIPINVGVCVTNVGTLYNVYDALFNNTPVLDKIVTVTGEVKNPKVIIVPLGTSVGDCIAAAGGTVHNSFAIILGGPMMGKVYKDGKEVLNTPITRTNGGIIVLPQDHQLVAARTLPMDTALKRARAACIQCRFCSDMCPRQLLGHKLYPNRVMRAVSNIGCGDDVVMSLICSECNVCELYACPMGVNPRTMNVLFKGKLREKGIKYTFDGKLYGDGLSDLRRVPVKRLIMRLGLSGYDRELEYDEELLSPDIVKLMTRDGVGKASTPVVNVGDNVIRGQEIADIDEKSLGVPLYASVSGSVLEVTNEYIVIRNER